MRYVEMFVRGRLRPLYCGDPDVHFLGAAGLARWFLVYPYNMSIVTARLGHFIFHVLCT